MGGGGSISRRVCDEIWINLVWNNADGSCGRKEVRGRRYGGGRDGGSDGTHLMPPHPVFSQRAATYWSDIQKFQKRGDIDGERGETPEKTRTPEEEGKRTREVEKAEGCRKRGHRWEGCRGPYARVGVNYHYPPKTRLSFCSREFLFVSFPVARPYPPTIRELRFLHSPLPPALALSHPSPLPLRTTVHLKYEFDITFHPTALARPPPRTSSSVSSLPAPIPSPVIAVRPLPVPAQFNCWHFIKSIDSAPSCLRLCKLMPWPAGRELFLASAFVGIGMWGGAGEGGREGGREEEGSQGGARKSSTKNLEINISSAASSGGERALTWPRV